MKTCLQTGRVCALPLASTLLTWHGG